MPAEDFNSNPVRIEDEDCVVVLNVTIVFGRKVNVRVQGEASRVRGVDLISLVDLERKVLDSHGVVPLKFSLGGDQGLDMLADGYPKVERYECDEVDASGAPQRNRSRVGM